MNNSTAGVMNHNNVITELPPGNFYLLDEQDQIPVLQVQNNLEPVTTEPIYGYIPDKKCHENEIYAVDLSTNKLAATFKKSLEECDPHNKTNKNVVGTAGALETFYSNKSYVCRLSPKLTSVKNADCTVFNHSINYKESVDITVINNYYSRLQQNHFENKRNIKRSNYNSSSNLLNNGTKSNLVSLIDQETQTIKLETEGTAIQTNKETRGPSLSLLQKIKPNNEKYSCTISNHIYTLKSNYGSHIKTHKKSGKRKIMNLRPTTAKLQVCKNDSSKEDVPVTHINKFKCDLCKKLFSSQFVRNNHKRVCIIEPFPVTKCEECHVTLYTEGAINDHVRFMHKKDTAKTSMYYCVFCSESFDASFTFHLHLDKHLSP